MELYLFVLIPRVKSFRKRRPYSDQCAIVQQPAMLFAVQKERLGANAHRAPIVDTPDGIVCGRCPAVRMCAECAATKNGRCADDKRGRKRLSERFPFFRSVVVKECTERLAAPTKPGVDMAGNVGVRAVVFGAFVAVAVVVVTDDDDAMAKFD